MGEISLNRRQYLEFEKLALGALDPLNGFMNEAEFDSVLENMRLPSGAVFPVPVVLDLSVEDAARLKGLPRVALIFDGEEVGEMVPSGSFSCDREASAAKLFGTGDLAHPGVEFFTRHMGEVFISGSVRLKKRANLDISSLEFTPEETKEIFAKRRWKTVVGFQTRNVPHRAHEYLQRVALEQVDGLFVQPLVGRKRIGDYAPEAIIAGYHALIDAYYPSDKVLLGVLSTYMRYAGPREAVFHAIVRRNYGCSHFIVGRDHAGVGDYYEKYAGHDLVRSFGDELGISVMCLHGPFYCAHCDGIVTEHTCQHYVEDPSVVTEISGTYMREILGGGREPEHHLMRPEVVESLSGLDLFISENEY
jgi:sulfate adenylyltransferase